MVLLDVNVLIALMDPCHQHHSAARAFFPKAQNEGWATCPLIENGVIRILSNPSYPNLNISSQVAREMLQVLCRVPGHQFWERGPSLRDEKLFPLLPTSKRLTDYYLLGLAVFYHAKFVTFDQRIDPNALSGGNEAYWILPQN